jgi:hypothetical protein
MRAAAVITFLIALYAMAGTWDHADALDAEAVEKEARAAAIAGEAVAAAIQQQDRSPPFTHPIPYSISIIQSGYGISTPRTHYAVGHRESK